MREAEESADCLPDASFKVWRIGCLSYDARFSRLVYTSVDCLEHLQRPLKGNITRYVEL